jgi:hypothetical protein
MISVLESPIVLVVPLRVLLLVLLVIDKLNLLRRISMMWGRLNNVVLSMISRSRTLEKFRRRLMGRMISLLAWFEWRIIQFE